MGRNAGAGGGAGGRSRAAPSPAGGGGGGTLVSSFKAANGEQLYLHVQTNVPVLSASARSVGTQVYVSKSATGRFPTVASGDFTAVEGGIHPEYTSVLPAFRRQGIASRMYQAAEKATGEKMVAGHNQTAAGKAFSKSFRGKRDS